VARTALDRRHAAMPDVAAAMRAQMVEALGYSGAEADVLREAGDTLRAIMVDTTADASDRLRAVGMVVEMIGPRQATRETDGARAPLVALTLVQSEPAPTRVDVLDVPVK
jgi:hypothetical protein